MGFEKLLKTINENGFWYGFDGLRDFDSVKRYGEPCHVHLFSKNDFKFDSENNEITIDIGNYMDKKVDYLLKQLFVPLDEMSFDLTKHIQENKIKLTLVNRVTNQDKQLLVEVQSFFKAIQISPEYKGTWG